MIPRNSIFFLLLIIPSFGFAQTMYEVKDSRFHQLADSLIKLETDSKTRECIKYGMTLECYYDTSKTISKQFSNAEYIKGVKVIYEFINTCNQHYSYQTQHFRGRTFEIIFDFSYKIVEQPDFELLKRITKIHNDCFISFERAQNIAIKNAKLKSRKTWCNELVYDLTCNKVYWYIQRESGFRKGVIETIKIDAKNEQVIEKSELPFRKGFFEALNDNIFKVP